MVQLGNGVPMALQTSTRLDGMRRLTHVGMLHMLTVLACMQRWWTRSSVAGILKQAADSSGVQAYAFTGRATWRRRGSATLARVSIVALCDSSAERSYTHLCVVCCAVCARRASLRRRQSRSRRRRQQTYRQSRTRHVPARYAYHTRYAGPKATYRTSLG